MVRSVVAPLVLGAGLVGYLASRGSTGPLAFDASTGELAIAGGGALGVLGALTGITGAPRPAPTGSVSPAPSASRAWWASRAFVARRRRRATPRRRRPRPGSPCRRTGALPPRLPGLPSDVPTSPCSRRRSPSPALAVPDLAGPGAGESGGSGRTRGALGSRVAATVLPRERVDGNGTHRREVVGGTGPPARVRPGRLRRPVRAGVGGSAPDGESAARPVTAGLVVLAPARSRRAARRTVP